MIVSDVAENPWLGDGAIKQVTTGRNKGKWRLQWTYLVGDLRERVDKLFALKGDASRWQDDKKVELRTGIRKEVVKARTLATAQTVLEEFAGMKDAGCEDGK